MTAARALPTALIVTLSYLLDACAPRTELRSPQSVTPPEEPFTDPECTAVTRTGDEKSAGLAEAKAVVALERQSGQPLRVLGRPAVSDWQWSRDGEHLSVALEAKSDGR